MLEDADTPAQPYKRTRGRKKGQYVRKPTRDEIDQRVNSVARMLARKNTPSEIRGFVRRLYGAELTQTTIDNYIKRAREILRARYLKTDDPEVGADPERIKDAHRLDAYSLYESICRNPESSAAEVMAAQAGINRLLGLDAPVKVANTDPSGEREALGRLRREVVLSPEARELLARLAESAGGLPPALPDGTLPENVVLESKNGQCNGAGGVVAGGDSQTRQEHGDGGAGHDASDGGQADAGFDEPPLGLQQ